MFEQEYQQLLDSAGLLKAHVDDFISKEELLLAAQTQLLAHVVHPDIEFSMPSLNSDPVVGGSGKGKSTFVPATGLAPAVFGVIPDPGFDNYYDCYATWRTMPNSAYQNFSMSFPFSFPTDTDMANAHCVELEARQVLRINGVRLGVVPALQANFTSGQLRYFDKAHGWVDSGIPIGARQRTMQMGFEAHRDSSFVYYDYVTLNGQRMPVTLKEALFPLNWGDRMSCSIQLDAHNKPFSINPGKGLKLEVW